MTKKDEMLSHVRTMVMQYGSADINLVIDDFMENPQRYAASSNPFYASAAALIIAITSGNGKGDLTGEQVNTFCKIALRGANSRADPDYGAFEHQGMTCACSRAQIVRLNHSVSKIRYIKPFVNLDLWFPPATEYSDIQPMQLPEKDVLRDVVYQYTQELRRQDDWRFNVEGLDLNPRLLLEMMEVLPGATASRVTLPPFPGAKENRTAVYFMGKDGDGILLPFRKE